MTLTHGRCTLELTVRAEKPDIPALVISAIA